MTQAQPCRPECAAGKRRRRVTLGRLPEQPREKSEHEVEERDPGESLSPKHKE